MELDEKEHIDDRQDQGDHEAVFDRPGIFAFDELFAHPASESAAESDAGAQFPVDVAEPDEDGQGERRDDHTHIGFDRVGRSGLGVEPRDQHVIHQVGHSGLNHAAVESQQEKDAVVRQARPPHGIGCFVGPVGRRRREKGEEDGEDHHPDEDPVEDDAGDPDGEKSAGYGAQH